MKNKKEFEPVQVDQYYPKIVIRLLEKILKLNSKKIVLFGFSDNMKWLVSLLCQKSIEVDLYDWRQKFINYDCGGKYILHVDNLKDDPDTFIIVCEEEINSLKNGISYLQKLGKNKINVIYDKSSPNLPFREEEPFKSIASNAQNRAISMISDTQLFDLIQFIKQTRKVEGDVVEFGSLHGGSGAVIAEAVKYFGEKQIWLFDTFEGIPVSKYGLDYNWNGSFSNNSFSEVRNAFKDLKNVKVIKGNIGETYKLVQNKISFGYIASDTYETVEILLKFLWSKLSVDGIICICDYGSFPNALPLTVFVDEFIEKIEDEVFTYRPDKFGIFLIKKKHK